MESETPQLIEQIQLQLSKVVEGQDEAIRMLSTALIAGGHVLLEGVPGVAKTLLASCLSCALSTSFSRIQFTPDLMPSDITGVNIYQPERGGFEFRPGPVFADIVLADEINRAPAKTQAALLEAMQERQVSIDGESRPLSETFFVVATQNPIEYEGTYPLPEAQLDRFLMKIFVDYPEEESERKMLSKMHEMGARSLKPVSVIEAVAGSKEVLELRHRAHRIQVDSSVIEYIVEIVRHSRRFASFNLGASPRAAIALLHASKARAVLDGKDYVTPDEVRTLTLPVLRHRVRLTPEAEIEGLSPDECLQSLLQQVKVPR